MRTKMFVLFLASFLVAFTSPAFARNSAGGGGSSNKGGGSQLTLSPTGYNFGSVNVGGSASASFSIVASGKVNSISASVNSRLFTLSGVPNSLNPGQQANFTVTFSPISAGTSTATLVIASSASNKPSASLSGSGVALQTHLLSVSPTSVNFGNINVGASSSVSVRLSNSGTGSVTISGAAVTGQGFGIGGISFPANLAPSQSINFTATFTPKAAGNASGGIAITSNATNSPANVFLSGTGTAPPVGMLSLIPASIDFGDVKIGDTAMLPVTVQNTGTASVTISQANVTGTGFGIMELIPPLVLDPGNSAQFTATFSPAATGSESGTISIVSDAGNSPSAEALSGAGVNPHSTDLNWTANALSDNVIGYNVYRSTITGGPYLKIADLVGDTAFTDINVQAGHEYFYVVTAVNSSNVESVYSNEAPALTPSP